MHLASELSLGSFSPTTVNRPLRQVPYTVTWDSCSALPLIFAIPNKKSLVFI